MITDEEEEYTPKERRIAKCLLEIGYIMEGFIVYRKHKLNFGMRLESVSDIDDDYEPMFQAEVHAQEPVNEIFTFNAPHPLDAVIECYRRAEAKYDMLLNIAG